MSIRRRALPCGKPGRIPRRPEETEAGQHSLPLPFGNRGLLENRAVEKLRQKMKEDYNSGYERAIEMVAGEKISLAEAENIVKADEPVHEVFVDKSKEFIDGFIDALKEMLKEAREEEEED